MPGAQPHWFAVPPPPQVSSWPHEPQFNASPHPSDMIPHAAFNCAHVFGQHAVVPHWFAPAPPQVSPDGQAPQLTIPPH